MSMRQKRNWESLAKCIEMMARPQGVTNAQLMEALGCSIETVHRLKRDLDKQGVPYYEDGRDARNRIIFKLEPGYLQRIPGIALPNVQLSEEELVALCLLRAGGGMLGGSSFEKRLASSFFKLGQSLSDKSSLHLGRMEQMLVCSGGGAKDYSDKEDDIFALITAAMQRKTCLITYHSFYDNTLKKFKIDPLSLVKSHGGLYCHVRLTSFGEMRILAVQRIRSLAVLEDTFEFPQGYDPKKEFRSAFGIVNNEPLTVKLWVSSDQARYVLESKLPPETTVETQDDGAIILEMKTSGRFEVCRWILSLGSSVRVLEPQDLQDEIRSELRNTLASYERILPS